MIKIILALTTISHQTAIPVIDIHDWVLPSYGSAMVFEIKRNGKKMTNSIIDWPSSLFKKCKSDFLASIIKNRYIHFTALSTV